jgi:hypothetical protein
MEDEAVPGALPVPDIVSNEIRKYQSDKGLRLQTKGCYTSNQRKRIEPCLMALFVVG